MQKGDSSKIGDPDNPSNSLYDVTQGTWWNTEGKNSIDISWSAGSDCDTLKKKLETDGVLESRNSSGIFNKIDSSESIPGDIGQQCWPGNAGGADHTGIYIGTVDGQRYYLHCTSWSPETNAKHSPGKGIVIGVSAKLDNNAARYHGFS